MDIIAFDWTLYWFMFPVAICVATSAMLSGIGGAAIFAPIFMIIFPLLGPEYPFESIAAAIGVALLTEVFGFSSGFVGYYRKGLIDFRSAIPFIKVGVPIGIIGAILLGVLSEYEEVLRGSYALLMLILSYIIIKHHGPHDAGPKTKSEVDGSLRKTNFRVINAKDGTKYEFSIPVQGKKRGGRDRIGCLSNRFTWCGHRGGGDASASKAQQCSHTSGSSDISIYSDSGCSFSIFHTDLLINSRRRYGCCTLECSSCLLYTSPSPRD